MIVVLKLLRPGDIHIPEGPIKSFLSRIPWGTIGAFVLGVLVFGACNTTTKFTYEQVRLQVQGEFPDRVVEYAAPYGSGVPSDNVTFVVILRDPQTDVRRLGVVSCTGVPFRLGVKCTSKGMLSGYDG